MAKKQKNTNSQAQTLARIQRTEAYAEHVRKLFAATVNEILALNKKMPTLKEGEMFSFDAESLSKQKEVERLLRQLHAVATMAIQRGIRLEWAQANAECDKLVQSVFGKKTKTAQYTAYMQRNESAMAAFMARSERGLNLSERVWKSCRQLRDEMEVAITVAVGDGTSAATMSRRVRQYLNDPDLMFRRFRYRVTDKDGNPKVDENGKPVYGLKWKKKITKEDGSVGWIDYDKDSYHDQWTGPGYYKSSAQNAMRVARTETNIAYRRADNERWKQMDFVLGQRVQLSRSHPKEDICDKLAGDYPPEFVFDGWHPQCFCFVTPILVDEDEIVKMNEAMLNGEEYRPRGKRITDYPGNFKEWVRTNGDKLRASHDAGKDPYFVRNNFNDVQNILNPKKQLTPLEIAEQRHAARTPEQEEAIRLRWQENRQRHAEEAAVAKAASKAAKEEAERIALQNDVSAEALKLPGAGWHAEISGKLPEQLEMYLDNYEIINGTSLTSHIRSRVASGSLSTKDIRGYIKLLKDTTTRNNEAMKVLATIRGADFGSLPQTWLQDALEALKKSSSLPLKDYLNDFTLDADGKEKVRALQHCANMIKLSKNDIAREYGLEKLSSKTPTELFERFFAKDKKLLAALPDKKFFDNLKHYVPLLRDTSGACCTWGYPPTVKISDDARFKTVAGLRGVLHHEYGHAYDRSSAFNASEIWSSTNAELRKEYDELKKIITSDWRTKAKSVLDKAYDDACVSKLPETEIAAIDAKFDTKKKLLDEEYFKFKISKNEWLQRYRLLEQERDMKLGILEAKSKISEIRTTISDIVEALDVPSHNSLGYGGHGVGYWRSDTNNDLAEFIAECSEARHLDYAVLKDAAPEIYELMLKYGKIFWP